MDGDTFFSLAATARLRASANLLLLRVIPNNLDITRIDSSRHRVLGRIARRVLSAQFSPPPSPQLTPTLSCL